jgi:hypothetical protein
MTDKIPTTVPKHDASRYLREWGGWGAARAYAKTNGAAGVIRMDGSYVLFFMDGATLRRKTFAEVRIGSVS